MLDQLSYFTFVLAGVFLLTGAYIWLRWGWVGVVTIWKARRVIDARVAVEVENVVIEP